MEALVVALSLVVGLTLGAIGGGGSMLLLPLLVYGIGLSASLAISTSLFVIGVTSLFALYPHTRAGHVRWRTGLVFGAAGMLGSVAGSRLSPLVPEWILLSSFGALLIGASIPLLRRRHTPEAPTAPTEGATTESVLTEASPSGGTPTEAARSRAPGLVPALGFAVGALSGLVGAGGGFLIIPALIGVAGLTVRDAIGTSLLAIALHSWAGFATHAALTPELIPWPLLALVTGAATFGSWGGAMLSRRIAPRRLEGALGVVLFFFGALLVLRTLGAAPLRALTDSGALPLAGSATLLAAAGLAAATAIVAAVALLGFARLRSGHGARGVLARARSRRSSERPRRAGLSTTAMMVTMAIVRRSDARDRRPTT